jgi:hypothetical protein
VLIASALTQQLRPNNDGPVVAGIDAPVVARDDTHVVTGVDIVGASSIRSWFVACRYANKLPSRSFETLRAYQAFTFMIAIALPNRYRSVTAQAFSIAAPWL